MKQNRYGLAGEI